MEENGWIKISRNITNHWVWQDANRLKWWMDLLMMANWDDNEVFVGTRMVLIKRGQMIASLSFLQQRWRISKNTLLGFLRMLEADGMITRETSGNITMLSVCQYENYQVRKLNNQLNMLNSSESDRLQEVDDIQIEQETEQPLIRQLNRKLNKLDNSESIDYTSSDVSSMNSKLNTNKEYNSCCCYLSAGAHTREESFFAEMKQNRSWQEQGVCMKHRITIEECMNYINEFELDCKMRNTSHADMRDVYNHFANWLIVKLKIQKDENNNGNDKRSSSTRSDDKRRGFEVTATSAEDYSTTF